MAALLQAVSIYLHTEMHINVPNRYAVLTCNAWLQLGAKDWLLWQRQTTMVDASCEFLPYSAVAVMPANFLHSWHK